MHAPLNCSLFECQRECLRTNTAFVLFLNKVCCIICCIFVILIIIEVPTLDKQTNKVGVLSKKMDCR